MSTVTPIVEGEGTCSEVPYNDGLSGKVNPAGVLTVAGRVKQVDGGCNIRILRDTDYIRGLLAGKILGSSASLRMTFI